MYVFELIDAESEPDRSKKIVTKPIFVKALECYRKQEFEDALNLFQEVEKIHPTDKAALLYIKRCQYIIKNGTSDDFSTIEIFKFQ